jgi:hypothetical protein
MKPSLCTLSLLTLCLFALPSGGEAATPTFFNNSGTFTAPLVSSVTDDYSNSGYAFISTNAVMSAVVGETDYTSTGHFNLLRRL